MSLLMFKFSFANDVDNNDPNADHTNYSDTLTLLVNQPLDTQKLSPLATHEKRELLAIFKSDGLDKKGYKYTEDDEVYEGDFKNDGTTLIAIISQGLLVDDPDNVNFFELKNNQLYETHFAILRKTYIESAYNNCVKSNDDPTMSDCRYEMHHMMGAYLKDGKTYLLFLPSADSILNKYDIDGLRLDRYLWENNKITKVEPSFIENQLSSQVESCEADLKSINKKFNDLYTHKKYQDANVVLSTFLSKCQFAISDLSKIMWMQNDLLISYINLKDKKGCFAASSQLQSNIDMINLKTHGYYYSISDKLKSASEFNMNKCRMLNSLTPSSTQQ